MVDFTTDTERKRCRQIDRCRDLLDDAYDSLGFGIDTRKATCRLIKLRNYLNKELPDKKIKAALKERDEMLHALVRIGNWCAQDLGECAPEGNYEKTLVGLCDICRPFMKEVMKLKDRRRHKGGDPNAVKTGGMLIAENERLRKALSDIAENLWIHLQIPTQTVSMNRLEVESMANDCEKALVKEGESDGSKHDRRRT